MCVLYDVFDCFPTNFSSHTRLRSANRKTRPSSQRISESEISNSFKSNSECSGGVVEFNSNNNKVDEELAAKTNHIKTPTPLTSDKFCQDSESGIEDSKCDRIHEDKTNSSRKTRPSLQRIETPTPYKSTFENSGVVDSKSDRIPQESTISPTRKSRPSSQRIETPLPLNSTSKNSELAELSSSETCQKAQKIVETPTSEVNEIVESKSAQLKSTLDNSEIVDYNKIEQENKSKSRKTRPSSQKLDSSTPLLKSTSLEVSGKVEFDNNKIETTSTIIDSNSDTMLAKSDSGFSEKATEGEDEEEDLDDEDYDHEEKPELSLDKAYQLFDKKIGRFANIDDSEEEFDNEFNSSCNGDFWDLFFSFYNVSRSFHI